MRLNYTNDDGAGIQLDLVSYIVIINVILCMVIMATTVCKEY